MTVDEVYVLMQYIINKNQQGYFDPAEFNLVFNQAQKGYVSYLLGSFAQYTPGRPIARVELGQNSVIRQRISPTIKRATLTIDGSGNANYPVGYLQTDSMWTSTGVNKIRFVEQDKLDSIYNSVIDPIATNPIYLLQDTNFQFYPVTTATAKLSYVKEPTDVFWAYKIDGNGLPVYTTGIASVPIISGGTGYSSATITFSPPVSGITATATVTVALGVVTAIVMTNYGTGYNNTTPTVTFNGVAGTGCVLGAAVVSVDSIFDDIAIADIVARGLQMTGVNLQAGAVLQYANELKNNGQ